MSADDIKNPFTSVSRLTGQKKAASAPKKAQEGSAEPKNDSNIADNIAILQSSDIAELRATAPFARTFRFMENEIEWLEDQAHKLSRKIPGKKKITQNDIIRLSIKLFVAEMKDRPDDIEAILKAIKQ